MYHKGEVQVLPTKGNVSDEEEDALFYKTGELPIAYDSRGGLNIPLPPRVAFLPHSCSRWIIGGPDEVKHLIADLMLALQPLCANEPHTPGFDEVVAVLRRDLLERKP